MRARAKARTVCKAKVRQRLVRTKFIDAKWSEKGGWRDPMMRANLAAVSSRFGPAGETAVSVVGEINPRHETDPRRKLLVGH
jgi:hypothetical protein